MIQYLLIFSKQDQWGLEIGETRDRGLGGKGTLNSLPLCSHSIYLIRMQPTTGHCMAGPATSGREEKKVNEVAVGRTSARTSLVVYSLNLLKVLSLNL